MKSKPFRKRVAVLLLLLVATGLFLMYANMSVSAIIKNYHGKQERMVSRFFLDDKKPDQKVAELNDLFHLEQEYIRKQETIEYLLFFIALSIFVIVGYWVMLMIKKAFRVEE